MNQQSQKMKSPLEKRIGSVFSPCHGYEKSIFKDPDGNVLMAIKME